ncbi:DNA topoisomerase IV subunit B [candidate division WWE3 bacterium RIFCSPHIGHO2_01_FULL_42_13]|uniref:DNA topoisomerase (ATP-hydrolyzing) n=1 Tax=candidate division WWE3 bacterium RIFCSPHIGHO2_01_FULL_42_13 TaxID=1802617 RepID=A0A1F4URM1_UNCKA|nr:MAG: DNA topoisomerase IV subunit B [candidate division WWE3 bacterium RIFCSPHIGHO2_01_FULL_42_13]
MATAIDKISSYTAEDIQVLEGLDPVRKRPGMYIGSTDLRGLQHLVTEIVNNSMDEAIAGYANHVRVEFRKDNSVVVYDNGRGIPYGIKKGYNVSALELAFTRLHAGGKFGGAGYKVSSGLHGVGASVVNALSDWCRVVVLNKPKKEIKIQEYEKGADVIHKLADLNSEKPKSQIKGAEWGIDLESWDYDTGTIVQFMPSTKTFETLDFKSPFFLRQLKEYAFLTKGIRFELVDEHDGSHYNYYFEGGIKTYLKALNKNKKPLHEVFYASREIDGVMVEVAMQYNDSFVENVVAFANHLKNIEGGTHLTGFRTALTKAINDYGRKKEWLKEKDANLSGEDLREGLTAVISVYLNSEDIQFEGQTKAKLGNSSVRPAVETVVKDGLEAFFEENPRDAQAVIEKNLLAMKARVAAKAARETVIRKSALEGGGVLPGKLADCASKVREDTELYIVEGDSAGGSAIAARDRKIQAILPVFGKVLNTERARLDKVVESQKFRDLIIAIGTGIGEQFEIARLRYGKLILMSDADVDGSHIMTLNLTFFFRHMPGLIDGGHVYLAVPPLYKATWGKSKKYLFDDGEREAFLKTPEGKNVIIQRFKGLGEMNAEELWETTMNPETRKLKQITVEDAGFADEVFTTLMGDEVPPRRKFIQTHAKQANIDIA